MGQNQSQHSDSADSGDQKLAPLTQDLEDFDHDTHGQQQSDRDGDNHHDGGDGGSDKSESGITQNLSSARIGKRDSSPQIAFSSQIPGSTQNLAPALRSHNTSRKRANPLTRLEIAESPERFVAPSPRADSPELNASPTRGRASAAEASNDGPNDITLDSSSQLTPGDESPEARRQRKLAKKEKRERKKNQKLAQAASAMAESVFDNHGLDALSAMDHQPSSYELGADITLDAPLEVDNFATTKPTKKRKGKKNKATDSTPQEDQVNTEGDLDQMAAFTDNSTFADPVASAEVVDNGDLVSAPASKKRRKSRAGDGPDKKKQKNGHTEDVQGIEDQYLEPQSVAETTHDQLMEDVTASPKAAKKKRKSKAKQAEVPQDEVEHMQLPNYANGADHSGLSYETYNQDVHDIPSHQPEPGLPFNPGPMSLSDLARAISSNVQSQYGASNIPIDPELAKYESNQDAADLLAGQHYTPEIPMHGLEVPMESQDLQMQYGTYADHHIDGPQVAPEAPATPSPAEATKPTKSTGRKRVAKPDFYSRVAQDFAELPSPSAAGLPASTNNGEHQANGQDPGAAEEDQDAFSPDPNRPAMRIPKTGTVLTGPFSDFELRNITQAIETWRVEHNMTQHDINAFIHGNPKDVNSSEFWNRVISTCPNRRRQKVINQCRRKFHNFVARGTWTPEQHDELSKMWELHGNKYTLIGQLINRHPEDVRDRIRNYVVCGDNRRKDAWSQEEEDRLANIVAEAIDAIRKMRERGGDRGPQPDEELVDWQMVSEKMDRTRSRLQCITKWKLIKAQLEGGAMDGEVLTLEEIIDKARKEAEGMTDRDRYNVVKAIKSCGAQADSRIPWAKVRAEKVGDKWSRATLMLVWHRLKVTVPDWRLQSVPAIAEYLCKSYSETNKLQFPSPEHLDLDNEYEEIEHKVSKIIKAHNRPKSAVHISEKDDMEDDAAAMDVSHPPMAEDGRPAVDDQEDNSTLAIQNQLEGTKDEDAPMGDAPDVHEDLGVSTEPSDANGQQEYDGAALPATNGHEETKHVEGRETVQEQDEEQLPQQEAAGAEVVEEHTDEEIGEAESAPRKTPKNKKTPTTSKKTPGTSRTDQSTSRRSAKKTYASRRGKKGETAAAAAAALSEDVHDASTNSSESDNESIPARI